MLLGYLNEAGLSDDQVSIVIGVGAHRLNTESEFIELCSENVCHRVRVVNHDAWDSKMTYLGKTSRGTEVAVNPIVAKADRLILTGGVVYHYMAGFGGGRKSILPGASSLKTIQQNHLLAFTDKIGGGSNPQVGSGISACGRCARIAAGLHFPVSPEKRGWGRNGRAFQAHHRIDPLSHTGSLSAL
jgi:nickel-dependent lactate racemase